MHADPAARKLLDGGPWHSRVALPVDAIRYLMSFAGIEEALFTISRYATAGASSVHLSISVFISAAKSASGIG